MKAKHVLTLISMVNYLPEVHPDFYKDNYHYKIGGVVEIDHLVIIMIAPLGMPSYYETEGADTFHIIDAMIENGIDEKEAEAVGYGEPPEEYQVEMIWYTGSEPKSHILTGDTVVSVLDEIRANIAEFKERDQ